MLLDKLSVKQQVKELERKFSDLVDFAYRALLRKNTEDNVRYFRSTFLSLDVSRKREHHKFIHQQLMKMDKEVTFDEIWEKLTDYWNFLNFDLLEYVVDKFHIDHLKQKMESYERDLQSFRKATRLCDFINCWPVQGETPPEADLKEFVAKMKHEWDNCTLEDLDKLKGVITRKFFLPEFALVLKQIKDGCVVITWLIPAPFVKALQEAIKTTNSEFFMEHKIEVITIDGQDCYSSPETKHSGHQQKPSVSITPPTPAETLHTVKPDTSEEDTSEEETMTLSDLKAWLPTHLGDTRPSSGYSSRSSSYASSGLSSGYSSRSSSYASSGLSSGYSSQSSSYASSGLSSGYSSRSSSYASSGLSSGYSTGSSSKDSSSRDLFYHLTPAEKYVRVHETSEHVELLPSVEQYLSKAEVEADQSLPTKYKDYLSSTRAIRAALYTTFNAKVAAEVFTWSQHTESPPPTTMTELFTAFTLKTLVDHLSTHPVYCKQQLKVTAFSDLPTDLYQPFQGLCTMAFEGIHNRFQLVFSAAHLPTGFVPLGLMHEVPQLYTESRASSYHFIHTTLQEFLAAVYISQLPAHEQTRLVREHLNSGHFKMTIGFLAGLTKLANITPDITRKLIESDKLTYFHCLFEAKDISRTLGSDEMVVRPHYSWTPLDYYVTGHAISHSNCPWKSFFCGSSDDDKFELFCHGCAALGGIGCKGHISYADFSCNDITSESIQSFVNIPPHILQDMRVLRLSDNKLDGSACDLLAEAVPTMFRLKELWLSNNRLGNDRTVKVINALYGSEVTQLYLSNTRIGEPDCEALCELLKLSHSLTHLYIHQNNLSSVSVASIITGLSHSSSLTTLNISNSHFSMANVVSLASILRDQSKGTLTRLELKNCHISGQGASELAAALCKNLTLKQLNLNHNPIGVEGASSMSDMLQYNTSLQYLHLCDSSVGEEGVRQLINSLKHNQTLSTLGLLKKYKRETSDHRIFWRW